MSQFVERECVHGHLIGKWNTYCKQGHTSNTSVVSKSDTNVAELTPKILNRIESLSSSDLVLEIYPTCGYPGYVTLRTSYMDVRQSVIVVKLDELVAAVRAVRTAS